jgi:hypothetical protein
VFAISRTESRATGWRVARGSTRELVRTLRPTLKARNRINSLISNSRQPESSGGLRAGFLPVYDWCAADGLELTTVRPFAVAGAIDDFSGPTHH